MRFERIRDPSIVQKRRDRVLGVLLFAVSVVMVATGHLAAIAGIVVAIGVWFGLNRW
jgi:hypothetical protein